MGDVHTATDLVQALVGSTVTDDGHRVAFLHTQGAELLGLTANAGGNTVYIDGTAGVGQVEVTIGFEIPLGTFLGGFGHLTGDPVEYFLGFGSSQELGNSHRSDGDMALVLTTGHLGVAAVLSALTYEGNNVTFLEAQLVKVSLGADTIYIDLTGVILDIDIAIVGLDNLGDGAGQTILGIAHGSGQELGHGSSDNSTLLRDGELAGVSLVALGSSEGHSGLTVSTLVGVSLEGNIRTIDFADTQPGLILFGDGDLESLTLVDKGYENLTAFLGQELGQDLGSFGVGIESLFHLDEGLVDLDDGNVYKLYSAVISGLGAFYGNFVTHLEAEAEEVLGIALGIQSTIDIYLAGIILQVPVTIGGIGDRSNHTRYAVRLGIGAGNNLGAGGGGNSGQTLDNIYQLGLAGAGELNLGGAAFAGTRLEADLALGTGAGGNGYGEPVGSLTHGDSVCSDGRNIYRTAGDGQRDISSGELKLCEIVIGLFLATYGQSQSGNDRSKNILEFHKMCRLIS